MPGESGGSCGGNSKGYGIQISISVFILLIGLLMFIIWVIVYSNRTQYKLPIEYWLWIILSFGLFFMVVGIIWLIIVLYAAATKRRACCEMHEKQQRSEMTEPMMGSSGQRSGAYFVSEGMRSS